MSKVYDNKKAMSIPNVSNGYMSPNKSKGKGKDVNNDRYLVQVEDSNKFNCIKMKHNQELVDQLEKVKTEIDFKLPLIHKHASINKDANVQIQLKNIKDSKLIKQCKIANKNQN